MFDATKRAGLMSRLLDHFGFHPTDRVAIDRLAPIAVANYPKGAEDPYLQTGLESRAVNQITNMFLRRQGGSVNDLYLLIFGIGEIEYQDAVVHHLE